MQIQYKALCKANDPRTHMMLTFDWSADDMRVHWTEKKIGRVPVDPQDEQRPSWKGLSMAEAGYLLDYLFGNPTRLDAALDAEFARLGVREQAEYFEAFCGPGKRHSRTLWTYGGRAFADLHFRDKYELLKTLKTRQPARA